MEQKTLDNINNWLGAEFDMDTHNEIKKLQKDNPKELEDSFYTDLEFGTGGIRGIMGVGTNRINKYNIGFVTQGLCNYLKAYFKNTEIKTAIAYDSRNNSKVFAEVAANIFAANGIQVFLFNELRPTPQLSFAIRHLQCQAGIVITASHNPKEYNGYKVYWNDGGQIVPPHDKLIIAEVSKIKKVNQVLWQGNKNNIKPLDSEMDIAYCNMVIDDLCLNKEVIKTQQNIKIVYTSIHGTGITLVPTLLQKMGFKNIHIVAEQQEPNGNFPSVIYPNPEEQEAMQLGLNYAKKIDADILLGTDPDSDRVGIGIKNNHNESILLNGNQTALLIFNYCIETYKKKYTDLDKYFIAKTIVTTDLINIIATQNKIKCYDVLTGFKWIASMILEKENKEKFIVGGEESYGILIGDKVRDKDAISAVAIICEMVAYYKQQNLSLFETLTQIYQRYGFYYEELLSITKKGMNGKKEITDLLTKFRTNIPHKICGIKVKKVIDYKNLEERDMMTGTATKVNLPASDVLQFILEDNSKISFRPSGTEPKIKYYFSVNLSINNNFDYLQYVNKAKEKINSIIQELNLKN